MVYNWSETLQSWLFPSICRLCRAPGLPGLELCRDCRAELPWIERGCRRCALPLPQNTGITLCFKCITEQGPLDACSALFSYRPPVDRWIQDLKFAQDLATARLLGGLLADRMSDGEQEIPAVVLPVPLHRNRQAERGYNQALEIARCLSRRGYRLDSACCRRHKPTSAQSGLPAAARRGNVRNAFSVSHIPDGHRVLLIDDVMTTGATLNELARSLKETGVERVEAWVIARSVIDKGGTG